MPSQIPPTNPNGPRAPSGHYFDDAYIQSVREGVLEALELVDNNNDNELLAAFNSTAKELPYDRKDIESLKSDDWFIRRFLKWEPTKVEQAIKTIHKVLCWRKSIRINEWTDATFPAEFYQVAACFSYLPDRAGQPVIIARLRFNRKDSKAQVAIEELARHYFIYVLEKIVSSHPNTGFGIIFDCHKASLSNVDLDSARFIINTLSNYYSGAISYVCIYELPWIFNQIWKLVRSWLDEDAKKIVRLCTMKDIDELIEPANLPDYMGGSGAKNYRHVPKGVPSIEEVARVLGIDSHKDVIKLSEYFQKLMQLG